MRSNRSHSNYDINCNSVLFNGRIIPSIVNICLAFTLHVYLILSDQCIASNLTKKKYTIILWLQPVDAALSGIKKYFICNTRLTVAHRRSNRTIYDVGSFNPVLVSTNRNHLAFMIRAKVLDFFFQSQKV